MSGAVANPARKIAIAAAAFVWVAWRSAWTYAKLGSAMSIASGGRTESPARKSVNARRWGLRLNGSCRRAPDLRPVLQRLHLLKRDESARHHCVERRQEDLDRGLVVDALDDPRQTLQQAQTPGRAQAARRVCRPKDEKAALPPQSPVITNWRASAPTKMRPSGPVSAAKKPITNEPMT